MKNPILTLIFLLVLCPLWAQVDNAGSGRALVLDGVDDYVSYGDAYHDVNLPFTISAWVYQDPTSSVNPIFCTNDNPLVYRGFIFYVSPIEMRCEFGDGTGGNNPAYRRGKLASVSNVVGRWIHVCAVMTAPDDIQLYINGVDLGGGTSGSSNLPMASSIPGDIAKSGYYIANSATYRFKGMIDEVRLWNRSLTQDEVRQGMCQKLTGNEAGLIGNWSFDETTGTLASDKSARGINAQIMGNPTRVFSGAPIGDASNYTYTSNWSGTSVSLQDGGDQMLVNNVQGNPEGVQLYEVKNPPSQQGGLPGSGVSQPYFGAFAASTHTGNSFTGSLNGYCAAYSRTDNSVASWVSSLNPVTNVLERIELINNPSQKFLVDLGHDTTVCDQSYFTLSSGVADPNALILWSTGETTASIKVSKSGTYAVAVSNGCGTTTDQIAVQLENSPPSISLGADQVICAFTPILLDPLAVSNGFQFKWQDNSTDTAFLAKDFGTYWVSVRNDCGSTSDTVKYAIQKGELGFVPNVITPNGDPHNEYFKLDEQWEGIVSVMVLNRWGKEVYRESSYMNDWNGGELDAGVYYLIIRGQCIDETKGWLSIIR